MHAVNTRVHIVSAAFVCDPSNAHDKRCGCGCGCYVTTAITWVVTDAAAMIYITTSVRGGVGCRYELVVVRVIVNNRDAGGA